MVFPSFVTSNPQLFSQNLHKLFELLRSSTSDTSKASVLLAISQVAKVDPKAVIPFTQSANFKAKLIDSKETVFFFFLTEALIPTLQEALFNSTTSPSVALIVKELLSTDSNLFSDWENDLKDEIAKNDSKVIFLAPLFAVLAEANTDSAKKYCAMIVDFSKKNQSDLEALQILLTSLKAISERNKEIVKEHLPYLKVLKNEKKRS